MSRLKKTPKVRDPTFAEILTDRICGGNNQHAIILIEGATGKGKSLASIRLAYDCSLHFAARLGGRPEDYFTLDNIGILTGEETIRVAKNIKKFGIYILDDAGAEGLNNRAWQSEQNKIMTKLLMTFRTNNNLLIMSSPDKGFVDKVARTLIHYKITMALAFFDKGITLGKLSTVKRIYTKDGSNNLYPFLRGHGVVFNYIKFRTPPDHLRIPYEKKRVEIERQMNTESITEFEELKYGVTIKDTKEEIKDKDKAKTLHASIYKRLLGSGLKASEALKIAKQETGLELSERTTQRNITKYLSA